LLNNGLDFVKVKRASQEFTTLNKSDQAVYFDQERAKTNDISMDKMNEEILRFCSYLFNNWLEDYRDYCERAKNRNLTHHKWFINEAVEKNIQEKCLPIDYFMERML
jgi:hypothetical protein